MIPPSHLLQLITLATTTTAQIAKITNTHSHYALHLFLEVLALPATTNFLVNRAFEQIIEDNSTLKDNPEP